MSLVAAEILTTGACPLECSYCYIPKTEYMREIHAKLVEHLQNGNYIELLKKVYGENLIHLGFWGTEPTLTLPLITDLLPALLNEFPLLEEIKFSTAMISDPSILANFAKTLSETGVKLKLSIQMSLDGPSWITDKNRMRGAAALIPKNLYSLVRNLNEQNLKEVTVEFRWKATHSMETIKLLSNDKRKIHEYLGFFESIRRRFNKINKNKNVKLLSASAPTTLVVPGKYTSEDGKIFAKYLRTLHKADYESTYSSRLNRIFKHGIDIDKRRQFTCSGGDSNLGIAPDRIHICHRTFYLDDDKYIQSVLDSESSVGDIENWDVSLFRKGTIDFVRDNFIVPVSDLPRFLYVLRGYHDFWRLQLGHVRAMLIELALAGQADEVYLEDEELATIFCLFTESALTCPMENLLNTGSIHLQTVSLIRLFANGAFQELLKEARR